MEIEAQEQQDSPDALCHECNSSKLNDTLLTFIHLPFHLPLVVRSHPASPILSIAPRTLYSTYPYSCILYQP